MHVSLNMNEEGVKAVDIYKNRSEHFKLKCSMQTILKIKMLREKKTFFLWFCSAILSRIGINVCKTIHILHEHIIFH